MKYIILIFISLVLVGCDNLNCIPRSIFKKRLLSSSIQYSKTEDIRCIKIKDEAWKVREREIAEKGKCEEVITGKLVDGSPDVTCKVMVNAWKECMQLPYDPKYKRQVSGSSFYRNKRICKRK